MAKKRNHNGVAENGAAKASEANAAYFLALTVRNVRCFGDEPRTLDLSDRKGKPARWTVLLGNNGTGKTTILQALAALEPIPLTASTIKNQFPGAAAFGGAPPRIIFRRGGKEFVRAGMERAQVVVSLANGKPLEERGTAYENVEFSFQTTGDTYITPPRPEGPPVVLNCYGYGASRRFSLKGLPETEVDDAAASLFSDDANLRNAEDWLLTLDYTSFRPSAIREQQERLRDLVTKLLIGILPDVEDIRFAAGEGTHPKPKVEAKTPYGWVPLRQLGHGYRTLVAWMVDLVSRLVERNPDSPNPLEAPAVVLVDEIDLHMHPFWQRTLMRELTDCFPNTQFIVTAHSPLIVQAAAEDANIALLRREGDHVVIDNDVGYIRGWRVDQLLTSELFGLPSARPPQYDDLLTRRRELLTKPKLTKADERELAQLEEQIGFLPGGETAEQAKAMTRIQQTLDRLENNSNDSR